jgi:hypothetical protein
MAVLLDVTVRSSFKVRFDFLPTAVAGTGADFECCDASN